MVERHATEQLTGLGGDAERATVVALQRVVDGAVLSRQVGIGRPDSTDRTAGRAVFRDVENVGGPDERRHLVVVVENVDDDRRHSRVRHESAVADRQQERVGLPRLEVERPQSGDDAAVTVDVDDVRGRLRTVERFQTERECRVATLVQVAGVDGE